MSIMPERFNSTSAPKYSGINVPIVRRTTDEQIAYLIDVGAQLTWLLGETRAKLAAAEAQLATARQDALNEAADYLDSVPTAIADPHSTANFLRAWAVQR